MALMSLYEGSIASLTGIWQASEMVDVRFDVAISFAGPERQLARTLAEALTADGFTVFFDEYFEHEMLGRDGADYLNRVFFEDSRYCVALISRNYEQSAWSQLERRAAQAREHAAGRAVLIPVLVDDERPSWLLPTRIYFDLARRSLDELRQSLRRKLMTEVDDLYRIAAELEGVYQDAPVSAASIPGTNDFLLWCTYEPIEPQPVKRLRWDAMTAEWNLETMRARLRGRWLFIHDERLVVVPDNGDKPIRVCRLDGREVGSFLSPRRYRWQMITDCKSVSHSLLLGYASGDVWKLNLMTLEAKEIREGTDDVEYVFMDTCGDSQVIVAREATEVEVFSVDGAQMVARHEIEEPAQAVWCFPSEDRVVIGGYHHLLVYRRGDWALIRREEIPGWAVFSPCKAEKAPFVGLLGGMPFASNALALYDAVTGSRAFRTFSRNPRGWKSLAISANAEAVAATTERNVVIFARRGPGTA
jgi:hypothetical protein